MARTWCFVYVVAAFIIISVKETHQTSTTSGGQATADDSGTSSDQQSSAASGDVAKPQSGKPRTARSLQSVVVNQVSGPEGSTSRVQISQNGMTKNYGTPESEVTIPENENKKPCFMSFSCMVNAAETFWTV